MSAPKWQNVTVKLADLKPWADNPRLSTKAQAKRLLASFEKFGQVQTVAIGPGLQVYDGHQRLSALLTIHGNGYTLDARQSDRELTEDERKELVVTLHAGAVGSWNADTLSGWNAKQVIEWGMDSTAIKDWKYNIKMVETMIESEQPPAQDAEPQIDRAEELREKWQTERGQLWQIGEHRLLCGDSTNREDVERMMGGEKASITFTSPPYNAGVSAKLRGNTSIDDNLYKDEYDDDQTEEKYFSLLRSFTDAALSVSNYIFVNIQPLAGNKRALVKYWNEFVNKFADVAIWDKGHAAPEQAQRVMDSRFEFVIIFSHDATRAIGTREFRGMVHNVYAGNPQRKNEFADMHAATFPVEFPAHFIGTFSNDGEKVYEPFCGTGTTLVACQNLQRRCRAIEISPAYCAVILERMATAFPGIDIRLLS